MKENDMIAIMLFNPGASMLDLDASGINSTNTQIKDEKEYLKLKQVTENPTFAGTDGNFSEQKFHSFYQDALRNYNTLANGGWQPTFEENNIFAPQSQKKQDISFTESLISNPFRQTISMKDIGEFGPQTKSIREIAEGQKVYDTATGKWLDTPEESFFGTIGMGPLVLAQWDFDADENGNPTDDPDKIKYKKGDYKYNSNGTFYYETLNGRNSTNKQLLHYSDIITKENSNWNKIDFLDSDDIEKSVMGTIAKNAALVGSLFLPFNIGYAITGATILQQSLKLGSVLGKMLLGSDNSFMNTLQAFSDATNLQSSKSDYAQEHVWSWENLINTAGDAISQLRQQRVLFEAIPWIAGYGEIGKGKGIFSSKGQEALQKELITKYSSTPLTQMRDKFSLEELALASQANTYNLQMKAAIEANNITKNLTKLSGAVSKAYMTGITTVDMYDEAKEAGMSDLGAMCLTLGYAAAEYGLLSTELGEMVLPELRAQRIQNKMLLSRLSDKTVQTLNQLESGAKTETERLGFIQRAFNTGKKIYEDNRAGLTKAGVNALVAGVGEGIEEISEEALADAFRGIHDLANWSSGRMFKGEDWLDRYGMNFIGGLIGGGVNGLTTDFSQIKRTSQLSANDALKELIYKINNGEINDIRKAIETTKWASTDLSAEKVITDEATGRTLWAQGTKEDNQNEFIKNMLRNQIDSVYNVLEANGAKITNDEFFDYNTLKQARFAMLANTSTAARYTEEYTDRLAKLVEIYKKEQELDKTTLDETKKGKEEGSADQEQYEKQKKELAEQKQQALQYIKDIKEGKQAARFIGTALLEIHPAIAQAFITGPTLDLFVQRTDKGHRHFKDLTEAEQTEYVEKYKTYKGSLCKDELVKAYDTWEYIMDAIQHNFAPNVQKYQESQDVYSKFLDQLLDTTTDYINDPKAFTHLANVINSYFDGTEATYIDTKINNSDALQKEFDENKRRAEQEAHDNEEKFNKQLEDFINDQNTRIQLAKDAQTDEINSKYDNLIAVIDSSLTPEQIEEETNRLNSERQSELDNVDNLIEEKYKFTEERKNKEDSINKNRKNSAKTIALEESYNNERAALKSLINSMHSILQTMQNRGYLNQVTKDKLRKVKLGLDNLIHIMNTYMLDPMGQGYTDIDNDSFIFAQNLHLGVTGEEEYQDFLDLFGEVSPIENEEGLYTPEVTTKGKVHEVSDMITKILETPESPILQLLDSFALDVLGQQTNFSTLLNNINTIIDSVKTVGPRIIPNMSQVDLTTVIPSIDQAILLGDLLYATLMGARSDSAGYEVNKQLSTGTPNFGFHFGINSIINEVRSQMGDDTQLLTIEGEVTDNIVKDLHTLIKNLKFYKDLYAINSGQKLATQPKITLRATQAIYKALRRLCNAAPEDYDKTPLNVFFQEGNIILENLDKDQVDDALLLQIEAERIKIEDALYEMGQLKQNQGKCFFNIEKLQDLFQNRSQILNENTKDIDMQSMLGYVISRMTIKASDFYNTFRQTISDKIAPLSIQELSVYLCTASVLNGDRMTELKNVVREKMLEYLKSLTEEKRIALFIQQGYKENAAKILGSNTYLPYLEELDTIPQYDNISFVEGIAGSGKTRAVLLMTKNVIQKVAPQLLDNVFIADITKKGAEDLGEKGLNLEEGKYKGFDKKELLQHISNWKEPSIKNGIYQFKEGIDYRVEGGKIVPAYQLNEGIEIPSLIVIDEVGKYTDLELKLIDQFAKKHRITVLTFGDLDQNKARGDVEIRIDKENLKKVGLEWNKDTMPMNIGIQRGQLLHGSKLGFSVRTRNIQQDKNQSLIQAKLQNPSGDINLSYYEGVDENGKFLLNGTKVVNDVDAVIEVVDKLSKNLNKDEKIGFIYESEESPLYKKLMEKYSSILQPYHKYDAQGREARYFVMELVPSTDDEQLTEELYTGITRAQDGMVLMTKNPMHTEGIYKIQNLEMDTIRKEQKLDPKDIKDFSEKRRNMYNSIFNDSTNILQYHERSKVEEQLSVEIPTFTVLNTKEEEDQFIVEVEPTSIENSKWLENLRGDKTIVTAFTSALNGTNVVVTLVNDANETTNLQLPGIITDYVNVVLPDEPSIGVEGQNNAILNPPTPPANPTPPVVTPSPTEWDAVNHTLNSQNDNMPIMVYTCASMELGGWTKDSNGKPTPIQPVSPHRIDSINGLLKIAPNADFDTLYEALFKLHNAINTCTSRNDLNLEISKILKSLNPSISDNISLQFGLWSSSRVNTTPHTSSYSIYERGTDERSLFNEIKDDNINNQNLSLAIQVDGKFQVLIPFGFLSSPFTIAQMYNNGNNPVMSIINKHGKTNLNDAVEEILNNHSIYQNYPALYNLFKLYRYTHNGFFPIKQNNTTGFIELGWETSGSNSFVPNKSLSNFGIQIIQDRGMRQINDKIYQWHSVKSQLPTVQKEDLFSVEELINDRRLNYSEQVYMFNSNSVVDSSGNNKPILRGRPFLLVSEKKYLNDEAMFDAFLNNDSNVKLVYLMPPSLTLKDYIRKAYEADATRSGEYPGNDATSFYILRELLKTEDGTDFLKRRLEDIYDGGKKGLFAKVKFVVDTLGNVYDKCYNADVLDRQAHNGCRTQNNFAEFIEILKGEIGEENDFFSGLSKVNYKLNKVVRLLVNASAGRVNLRGSRTIQVDESLLNELDNLVDIAIYENVKFQKNVQAIKGIAIPIQADSDNNYKYRGQFLQTDVRVTTSTFGTQELNGFIDSLVNYNIHPGTSTQNDRLNNTQPEKSLHNRFIGTTTVVYQPNVYNNLVQDIKTKLGINVTNVTINNQADEEKYIQLLIKKINNDANNRGIILKIGNDYVIRQIPDSISINTSKSLDNFTLVIDGVEYKVTDNGKQIIPQNQQVVTPGQGTYTADTLISDLIEEFKDSEDTILQEWLDTANFAEINTLGEALEASPEEAIPDIFKNITNTNNNNNCEIINLI